MFSRALARSGFASRSTTESAYTPSHYRTITVDNTKVGASTHANFPVLVEVALPTNVKHPRGWDIRPYADLARTMPLAYELMSYNPATGAARLWVKVPTLSHTAATTFYLFYGDAAVRKSGEDATGTWSVYGGVYHLEEEMYSDNDSLGDSAAPRNMAVLPLNTIYSRGTDGVSGQVGRSFDVALTTQYSGRHARSPELSGISLVGGRTASGWVLIRQHMSTEAVDLRFFGWQQPTYPANELTVAYKRDTSVFKVYGGYDTPQPVGTYPLALNTPYHVAVTWDGATVCLYVNGVKVIDEAYSRPIPADSFLGIYNGAVRGTNGWVDEVRFANGMRSADWLLAEYNNQNDPATFSITSTEQAVSSGSSGQTVTPISAVKSWFALAASVVATVAVQAAAATSAWAAPTPTATNGITVTAEPAAVTRTALTPSIQSAVSVITETAGNQWIVSTPNVVAAVSVVAPAATGQWTTLTPSVAVVGAVIPNAAQRQWTTLTPSVATAISVSPASAVRPWTILTPVAELVTGLVPTAAARSWVTLTPAIATSVTVPMQVVSTSWGLNAVTLVAEGGPQVALTDPAVRGWSVLTPTTTTAVTVVMPASIATSGAYTPSIGGTSFTVAGIAIRSWSVNVPTVVIGGITATPAAATRQWVISPSVFKEPDDPIVYAIGPLVVNVQSRSVTIRPAANSTTIIAHN